MLVERIISMLTIKNIIADIDKKLMMTNVNWKNLIHICKKNKNKIVSPILVEKTLTNIEQGIMVVYNKK